MSCEIWKNKKESSYCLIIGKSNLITNENNEKTHTFDKKDEVDAMLTYQKIIESQIN